MMKVPLDEVPHFGALAKELLLAAKMYEHHRTDRSRSEKAMRARAERQRLQPRATTTEAITIRRLSGLNVSAIQIKRSHYRHLSIEEIEKYMAAP